MEARSLQFIAEACDGQLQGPPGREVRMICTDSRRAHPGDFFIALAGDKFNGHDFLEPVLRQRVKAIMVEGARLEQVRAALAAAGDAPCIIVDDTRRALGRLAAAYRRDFTLPVFAVAGSNGKTTTKDLLAAVLKERLEVVASEASFNNDIGVPLSLLRLERKHEAAVLEIGTNHPGELAPLVQMIRPLFGLLTGLGREHLEFFGDLDGVAREEGMLAEMLPRGGRFFVHANNAWAEGVARRSRAAVVRVGLEPGADWRAVSLRTDPLGVTFSVETAQPEYAGEYRVNLLGRHQVTNALLALAAGAKLGLSREDLAHGLAAAVPPKMRMQSCDVRGMRILDDTYNANADSMLAALQTLADLPCAGRRIAVLGDMAELGDQAPTAHAEVGRRAAELQLHGLLAVGRRARETAEAASASGLVESKALAGVEEVVAELRTVARAGDVILLKASRAARLERMVEMLRAAPEG